MDPSQSSPSVPGTLQNDTTQPASEHSGPIEYENITPINKKTIETEWKPYVKTVEENIVPGLSNDDFWLLVRRFNKVPMSLFLFISFLLTIMLTSRSFESQLQL